MLKALTGLRFLLAIYVVFFHNLSFFEGTGLLHLFISKGYCAVSAFFLLSGFVLAYRYTPLHSKQEWQQYLLARFARIYPLYLLALLIELPLCAYFIYKTYVHEWFSSLLSIVVANVLMIQSWNEEWLGQLNGPGWSLSVELVFYLCFPFILLLFEQLAKLRLLLLCSTCLYGLIVLEAPASFVRSSYTFFSLPLNTDAHPLVHLPTFMIGVALGIFLKKNGRISVIKDQKLFLFFPFLSFLLLLLAVVLHSMGGYNINNGLLVPIFILLMLGLINPGNFLSKLLSKKVFQLLGNASFGVYLLQSPIRRWMSLGFETTGLMQLLGAHFFFIFYFIVLIVLSVLIFQIYEKPLNNWLRTQQPAFSKTQ